MNYLVSIEALFARFFAWLMRRMPNERQRLLAITIVAGGVCGLAAVAFHISVSWLYGQVIDRAASSPGHSWIWWTILAPAIGGLVAGLGLTYWVPAAAGSGIPQVKTAYTFRSGAITIKETVGKFVLCAFQLGTGASLGVEGPTVQICAGVSSFLSRMARLSPANQKRMTSVGMAAGIAAAFNAPIAAVTFTLEE
ncbi:MAG: chloride channel protein, partial [Terracidiphilus sp.]